MNQCKLDDENFEQLMFAISRQKCILMLGPDASVEEKKNVNKPAVTAQQIAIVFCLYSSSPGGAYTTIQTMKENRRRPNTHVPNI